MTALSAFLLREDWLHAFSCALMPDAPLAPHTWFRVGGPADFLFTPSSMEELKLFLKECPDHIPYTLLGAGSNMLVRDGGIAGVVISLKKAFNVVTTYEGTMLDVGAAVLDKKIAKIACDAGIGGLEFLYTIPGTLGGALRMNAGAFGREIKDVFVHALALDSKGHLHCLKPSEMRFGYRSCGVPEDWIFVGARLKGVKRSSESIATEMQQLSAQRRATQPSGLTGGSTFQNPLPDKAWELLDKAGMRGVQKGGAQFSEKHCNFMLNTGKATASDLEGLGEMAREKVYDATGVRLEWEIKRVGRL